jgi:ribosome-associated heat shock protein Hsp15
VVGVRLDVWLDVACLFKTRTEAQRACKLGQITVNGAAAKPHRELRPGDALVIARPYGRRQTIVVRALADTHRPKAEARSLYDDQTPRPTAAELEQRRLERMYRAAATPVTRPHRRDRRALRRLTGKE